MCIFYSNNKEYSNDISVNCGKLVHNHYTTIFQTDTQINLMTCDDITEISINHNSTLKFIALIINENISKPITLLELPRTLKKLSVSRKDITIDLPETLNDITIDITIVSLPETLEWLWIKGENIKILQELPDSITSMNIDRSFKIQNIPTSLKILDVCPSNFGDNCSDIFKTSNLDQLELHGYSCIPELPETLYYLKLIACCNITNQSIISKDLQNLSINYCDETIYNVIFPETLKCLYINDRNMVNFPVNLPSHINIITIQECHDLVSITNLPETITNLCLINCYALEYIDKFPTSLEKLDISGCEKLQELPKFPTSMIEINFTDLIIKQIYLPEKLKFFTAENCNELETIHFSEQLDSFYLEYCNKIEKITFPKLLPRIIIKECENIKKITKFPETLTELCLVKCPNLEELPAFSNKLTYLNIKCNSLIFLNWGSLDNIPINGISKNYEKNFFNINNISKKYEEYKKKLCKEVSEKIRNELVMKTYKNLLI